MTIALQNTSKSYFIFTDSESALKALLNNKQNIKNNKNILEIRQKFIDFSQNNSNNSIKFFWIPAHFGIEGNEQADILAKQATNHDSEIKHLPYTDFFENFKKQAFEKTKKLVKNQGLIKGTNYFKYFYSEQKHPWFNNLKVTRVIVTINRLRANHYNLAASLSRMGIVENPYCVCEEEVQDINHILWQCKMFDKQRFKQLESLRKLKYYLPLNVDIFIYKPINL